MRPEKKVAYRYAGLSQVDLPGLSVADAASQLRRLAEVEMRLMRLYASRVVLLPERDFKLLLARLQYEACQHADVLRNRVPELRVSKKKVHSSPDGNLTIFFDEVDHVPGSYPFLAVLVQFILPSLIRAYQTYVDTTNHLADYPSVRIVKQNLQETAEHLQILSNVLTDLAPRDEERRLAQDWVDRLSAYLGAAGGILDLQLQSTLPDHPISRQPFRISRELKRDKTFNRVWDFKKPQLDEVESYLDYMMALRLSETNVSEGLALVLCEVENRPWSFYVDISRHLWDEMRHSIFGEVAIESTYGDRSTLPIRDYEGIFAFEAELLEQYAVLGLEIEGANMRYPPGKRQEWEFCRDTAQHPLMTTFQDFDWADEVLHVNIARRQLDEWFEGGLKSIVSFSKAGKEHRTRVKERYQPTSISAIRK